MERDRVIAHARAYDDPAADAVLLPDTALHTVAFLDELEDAVGKTVLTANQVSDLGGPQAGGSASAAGRARDVVPNGNSGPGRIAPSCFTVGRHVRRGAQLRPSSAGVGQRLADRPRAPDVLQAAAKASRFSTIVAYTLARTNPCVGLSSRLLRP